MHDASSIYAVPLMLEEQQVSHLLSDRLSLNLNTHRPRNFMKKWRDLSTKHEHLRYSVTIVLVGKYTQLEDSYASVIKALQHAALACNRKLELKCMEAEDLEEEAKANRPVKYYEAWQNVCKANGIIVPGGFGQRGMEGKVAVCKWARTMKKPLLGVCLGLQAAVIEYSRNVLGWADANSQEMSPEGTRHVIVEMPEHNPGQLGGTMRLGKRQTVFKSHDSKLRQLYGNVDYVEERHRHRFEVNPKFVADLEAAGMKFVGHDVDGERMEIMELADHPYYVACQYHPEYLTRPLKPSPPYLGLILASSGKLEQYLSRGCRMSPTDSPESSDEELPMPPHLLVHQTDKPSMSPASRTTPPPTLQEMPTSALNSTPSPAEKGDLEESKQSL